MLLLSYATKVDYACVPCNNQCYNRRTLCVDTRTSIYVELDTWAHVRWVCLKHAYGEPIGQGRGGPAALRMARASARTMSDEMAAKWWV